MMLPYITLLGKHIPTYGLCMVVGFLLCAYIAFLRLRKTQNDVNSFIIIAACIVGNALLCAKLLYIFITYDLQDIMHISSFEELAELANSGLVYYGGLIGGIAGAFAGSRLAKVDLVPYCDALVPCIPLGHALGRLGCFCSGCCYGLPYEGIGSVHFTVMGIDHAVFPIQLVEMLLNLLLFITLLLYTQKKSVQYSSLAIYLCSYAVIRFILEFFRGDLIRGSAVGLSTSQWISIGLLIISAVYLIIIKYMRKNVALV